MQKLVKAIKDSRLALANLAIELKVSRPDKHEEIINAANMLGTWLEEIEKAKEVGMCICGRKKYG
jgi:hypothetical protein